MHKLSDDNSHKTDFLADYVKLELEILKTLGYGIDLTSCAVSDATTGLAFVSPKSARAVTLEVGEPHKHRLLRLPNFLVEDSQCDENHLLDGMRLSGYFLEKFVFEERSILERRQQFSYREKIAKTLSV